MAKQGQKLTDEMREQIRAHLVLSDNKNEIAKTLGVSWSTVDKVAKEVANNPDEKEEFEKRIQSLVRSAQRVTDILEVGSLQRSVALLFGMDRHV